MPVPVGLFASLLEPRTAMSPFRALVAVLLAALVAAPAALAQTGQQLYVSAQCQGCHGNPANNTDNVLGGKEWMVTKLAMDTKPEMTAVLRPLYNAGLLTDNDFMLIAGYLQTFVGGPEGRLGMPTAHNFGTVTVGVGSAIATKTISHIGNASVQLTSVTSSNPLEFVIVGGTCTAGLFVNPLSSCTVQVQFTPATTGARNGQITIVSNGIGSPQSFAVSGTGGTGGAGTPALTMPAATNFGTVNVGASSSVVAKTISSTGTAAAQITTVTSTNPSEFAIVSRTCTDGATVTAGSSCTVSVQFSPAASGARNGQITVTSNGTGSPQSFAVSGTGQTVAGSPALSVPASANLGSSAVGVQTAGTQITINSTGTASTTITSVLSSSASEFPIVGNTCGVVVAGSNCKVTVAFRPLAAGARSGSITVASNAPGSPHTVSLSGTGTSVAPTANKVTVVEYFNAGFGHYFMTADTDEITGLDGGAYNFAFLRTNRAFNAWNGPTAGTVPVCRFFTTPGTFGTKSSHFYTANPDECEGLKSNPNWQYEKIAFYIAVPTAGTCPVGTTPVYRMYNNGQTNAPNHRFSTDFLTYQDFTTTKGWAVEGTGFCSPP
jgi:mono/diheme cytochrome c family protein